MNKAIQVVNLLKKFEEFVALDSINFDVEYGEIFGYLGPNGAGKTTTIRILTAISRPTSGTVLIAGHNIEKKEYQAKKKLSHVPENPIVYPELSGWDNLIFTAGLYRISRKERTHSAERLLKDFNLFDRRHQQAVYYSKGMKKKLSLAMGLISNPEILFLDEPTSGLDVESQRLIREKINDFREKGNTVFLTTHNLSEAAHLCNRVAILDKGKILTIDSPNHLQEAMVEVRSFEFELKSSHSPEVVLKTYFQETNDERDFIFLNKQKVRVYTPNPTSWGQEFLDWTRVNKIPFGAFGTAEANLEDVFVSLTGKGKLGHPQKDIKRGKSQRG